MIKITWWKNRRKKYRIISLRKTPILIFYYFFLPFIERHIGCLWAVFPTPSIELSAVSKIKRYMITCPQFQKYRLWSGKGRKRSKHDLENKKHKTKQKKTPQIRAKLLCGPNQRLPYKSNLKILNFKVKLLLVKTKLFQ